MTLCFRVSIGRPHRELWKVVGGVCLWFGVARFLNGTVATLSNDNRRTDLVG